MVDIFCANEQEVTPHTTEVDNNGEIVATCKSCDRAVKFPAGLDVKGLKDLIKVHQEVNELTEEQKAIEEARKASEATLEKLTKDSGE